VEGDGSCTRRVAQPVAVASEPAGGWPAPHHKGPTYLRSTGRAGLPDVVAGHNGQIDIVLDGRVDSIHGRLRTT
jgi:hypothetical protein